MKPQVVVLITQDPRTSGRPAEAVRIAAGVGAWKKVDVAVYLRGPAVLVLSEFVDDLVDEDNFTRYLPLIGEAGRSIWVQRGAAEMAELGDSPIQFSELGEPELATLISGATYVFNF